MTQGQDIYLTGCFTKPLFSPPSPSDSLAFSQVFAITLYFNQRTETKRDKNQNNKCNHLGEKVWCEGWDHLKTALSHVHCACCVWGKRYECWIRMHQCSAAGLSNEEKTLAFCKKFNPQNSELYHHILSDEITYKEILYFSIINFGRIILCIVVDFGTCICSIRWDVL